MGSTKINRNFIVAHQSEARPLIDYYHLTKDVSYRAFPVYANENVKLVISGEGKINCAAATAYAYDLNNHFSVPVIWINIGIVGHAVHEIGSLWRVNKSIDATTSNVVFPINVLRSAGINGESLLTVDKPETVYSQQALYDMEASAFFQTASRFSSLESITSFKIVSDNKENRLEKITLEMATKLIQVQIEAIDRYLEKFENYMMVYFKKSNQIIDIKEQLFSKYRFTHSQKRQCEELLHSLAIHEVQYDYQELLANTQAKQILNSLNGHLTQVQLAT